MRQQGIASQNFQWGYRITHFFAVENRYRRRGTPHGAEREQFRDLVDALHTRGISVLVDFVFNHTGENMEGADRGFTFGGIDPLYYFRTNAAGERIGPYGNEIRSEGRPMVQRWLIDQMRHFVEVFGVDGFRIDLAGQTDEQTLRAIREALGPDILIYGEPWIDISDPEARAVPGVLGETTPVDGPLAAVGSIASPIVWALAAFLALAAAAILLPRRTAGAAR